MESLVHKGPVCRPTQSPQLRCPFLELLHCAAACRILPNGIDGTLLHLGRCSLLCDPLRVPECLLGGVALQLLVLFPLFGLLLIGVLLDAESLCRFSFHRHHVGVMLHFSLRAFHLFRSPNRFSFLGIGFLTGSLQCLSFIRSGVSGLLLGVDAPREILVLQSLDLLVTGNGQFSLVDLCLLLEGILLVGLQGLLNCLRTVLQSLTLFPHLPLMVHHPCGQVLVPLVDVLLGLRSLLAHQDVVFLLLRVLQSALKLCVCQVLSAEVLLVPLLELRGNGVTNIGAVSRLSDVHTELRRLHLQRAHVSGTFLEDLPDTGLQLLSGKRLHVVPRIVGQLIRNAFQINGPVVVEVVQHGLKRRPNCRFTFRSVSLIQFILALGQLITEPADLNLAQSIDGGQVQFGVDVLDFVLQFSNRFLVFHGVVFSGKAVLSFPGVLDIGLNRE